MKKVFVIILSVIMLMVTASPVVAIDSGNEYGNDVKTILKSAVEETVVNGSYVKTISQEGLDAVRRVNSERTSRDVDNFIDPNVELLYSLGFDTNDIATFSDEEIQNIGQNSLAITSVETYYRTDEDGNIEKTTREDYLAAETDLATTGSGMTRGNSNSQTSYSDDGLFKIHMIAAYVTPSSRNNEAGWYLISGLYEFLTLPTVRQTDAASLYSSGVAWSSSSGDYQSTMMYDYRDSANELHTVTSTKTTVDRHPTEEGLYYTWELPDTFHVAGEMEFYRIIGLRIRVRSYARVRDQSTTWNFNVLGRYINTYKKPSADISFGWEIGGAPGVSVTPSMETYVHQYEGALYVSYTP